MRKFSVHLLFWVVFFLMWYRIVYFYISNIVNRLFFSVLDVSLIVVAFYIIYFYIMPDYVRRKSVARLMLLSVLLIGVSGGIYLWMMWISLNHMLMPINFNFSWNYTDLEYNRFFIALLGVLAGCFVKLAVDRLEVGRKMEAMEKEKSLAELTYLKAQVNPHFLFNSLNSLHAQLELKSDGAKETLTSLADLLRYQLYECNADFIPVDRELAYLENYFNLQSIRKDNCSASLVINGEHRNLLIAPLLLIPFIENAFKYVSDYDGQENFIRINAGFVNGEMHFDCVNTFDVKSQQPGHTGKGIGLTNVQKRLELIYGDKYRLKQETNNGLYQITLTLNLK